MENPLLISVRSGARDSMPGMMDTILNLGMNDATVDIVAAKTSNPKFAWDSYRRFLQMYGDVVMGVQRRPEEDHEPFESAIEHLKDERYGNHHFPDTQLSTDDLKELVSRFKALIRERTGKDFPQDPKDSVMGRDRRGFWLLEQRSRDRLSQKVRHPARVGHGRQRADDGLRQYGRNQRHRRCLYARPGHRRKSLLWRIPHQCARRGRRRGGADAEPVLQLSKEMPESYKQLLKVRELLEKHFRDMQDLEFTIEDNRLYILQTRNGKRTGLAAIKIAVDMVKERLISKEEAILRIPADSLSHVLAPIFDKESVKKATQDCQRAARRTRRCQRTPGSSGGGSRACAPIAASACFLFASKPLPKIFAE